MGYHFTVWRQFFPVIKYQQSQWIFTLLKPSKLTKKNKIVDKFLKNILKQLLFLNP